MNIIPAIDLIKGNVVRLSRGDPSTAKVYDQWGTPVQVAMKWKAEGAKRLHVIDLDAAFGIGDNKAVVAKVAQASGLPIQAGGGIRTLEAAEKMLKLGVECVILGSLAFSDPEAVRLIQEKFGVDSVIVALDNKDGRVMVEGWKNQMAFTMPEALEKFVKLGARSFLITSISKDGMLQGLDLDMLREAAAYPNVEIIAAGGVSSLDDLVALGKVGVEGVVVGKALYEGRFTLEEAIDAAKGN